MDSNCKHLDSEIAKIQVHKVNTRTEEKVTSLGNRLDQAEVCHRSTHTRVLLNDL